MRAVVFHGIGDLHLDDVKEPPMHDSTDAIVRSPRVQSRCGQPHGPHSGTAFFGGTEDSGSFHQLQADVVRVPFANVGMVKVAPDTSHGDAALLSNTLPTGAFAAMLTETKRAETVCILGCGPRASSPS